MKSKPKPKPKPKPKVKPAPARSDLPRRAIIARQWNKTEADLIDVLGDDLQAAWKKLRAFAAGLGRQQIYASAQSIMFARKVCYFYVKPKKTALELWIFLPRKIAGLVVTQAPTKKEKYGNVFKLVHADQVETPLTDWLREAFDFAPDLGD